MDFGARPCVINGYHLLEGHEGNENDEAMKARGIHCQTNLESGASSSELAFFGFIAYDDPPFYSFPHLWVLDLCFDPAIYHGDEANGDDGKASEEGTTGEEAKPAEKKLPKKKDEKGGEDAPQAKNRWPHLACNQIFR